MSKQKLGIELLSLERELCAMQSKGKRKYRGSEFAVNIASSVPPDVFREIEELARVLGTTKSEVFRRLIVVGLDHYRRNGTLLAEPADD